MAVESKPLFHPEVIRQHLRLFTLPDSVSSILPAGDGTWQPPGLVKMK